MINFWDDRYSQLEYIYGVNPNEFFAEQIQKLTPGKIILPCEGEGRNAVFAATLGWQVKAFDLSEEGRKKAMKLANTKWVKIEYQLINAALAEYTPGTADLVAFIFVHLPPIVRTSLHQKAITWLKPGGRILLEAFHPLQLQNISGGPSELSMLYTEEMIRKDFQSLEIEQLLTKKIILSEGNYHKGIADIIRFVGIKK